MNLVKKQIFNIPSVVTNNKQDLFILILIVLTSISFSLIWTYGSYIFVLAILLVIGAGMVFFKRPEWFLYLLAFSRISLDAVKVFYSSVYEIESRWDLSFDGVITGLLLLCALFYFLRHRDIKIFKLPGAKAYISFLVICLVSLTISLDRIYGIRHLIHYLSYFIIYVLVVNIIDTKKKNHKMIFFILLSTVIPLSVGFYQAITVKGNLFTRGFNRIDATTSHPNAYGAYLMIMLIFILTMYFYLNSFKKKAFLLVLGAFTLISLILTYSRGAWLGFTFGICIFIPVLMRKLNLRNLILLVVFLVLNFTIFSFFLPEITGRFSDLTGVGMGTFGWRRIVWQMNFDEFLKHPIRGYGIGSSMVLIGEIPGSIMPHNDYLKLMVETGIFGAVAYVTVMILLLRFFFREYKKNLGTRKGILAAGLIAVIFSILLLHSASNLSAYDIAFSYFWFLIAAGFNLLKET